MNNEELETIETFDDKLNREICLKDDGYWAIYAYHNDIEIARFEYDSDGNDLRILHMNVVDNYRYCGIGTQMIQSLKEHHVVNVILPRNYEENRDASFYLIDDGIHFKTHLQDKGIL